MTGDESGTDAPAERWEPRPTPVVTPETADYWRAASEGRLTLGHCPDCDLTFFYPRAYCPDCLGATESVEASGEGTVYSYSVPRKISGWPEDALPLVVAFVELAEGPRVVTNVVDCDPDDVDVGAPVAVTFVPTEDPDVAIPVFELSE